MAVYKFRVVFEDHEDVTRDIEIKPGQTFEDFHSIILQSVKFDNKHAASFFVSDDYWRKEQEITLLEEDMDSDTRLMKNTKISTYVENPYQRFIYIYDKKVQWTFLIELIKIESENPKTAYPVCSKSAGQPPKQYKQLITDVQKAPASKDPLAALLGDVEEEEELAEEAYKSAGDPELGLDEGDLDYTPGEEGEAGSEEEGSEEMEESEEGEDFGFEGGNDRDEDF